MKIASMLTYTGLRRERVLASTQYRDGTFHNTSGATAALPRNSFGIMREFFLGGPARVPSAPLPVVDPRLTWRTPVSPSGLRVTWMGHSTLLFEVDGRRILADPVFGERASPVSFAGARRLHPAPVTIEQLPPLDAVLLSHDHYDHLCRASMREIAALRVPVITSLGVGARLEQMGVDARLITELDWWESHEMFGGTLSFTATPAQHFSGRGVRDRNRTLWSSWVIRTDQRQLFFSGDTGLTDDLALIAQRFGPFDLTMLEIGAANPAWSAIHLGPENALRAFDLLGSGTLLPIHWSTFDLALHRWCEPAETLVQLADVAGVRVLSPMIGQPIEPAAVNGATPWWRTVERERGNATHVTKPEGHAQVVERHLHESYASMHSAPGTMQY